MADLERRMCARMDAHQTAFDNLTSSVGTLQASTLDTQATVKAMEKSTKSLENFFVAS